MKNPIRNLLIPLLGLLYVTTASAGEFYIKSAPLQWLRTSVGTDNPRAGLNAFYSQALADGNHNSANAGVALVFQDTSGVIDVRDHWAKIAPIFVTKVTNLDIPDSTEFGTLVLRGSRSSIDSVTVIRDVSPDGFAWTSVDSQAVHIATNQSTSNAAVADSVVIILTTLTDPIQGTSSAGAILYSCNPAVNPAGVTALALRNVQYVRFRIHMTAGDFAAAGTTNGVIATFQYPAQEPSYNR